jgi:hypothetical protein
MTTTNDESQDAVKKLMDDAEMMAHYSIRQRGSITPTLLIHGVDGNVSLTPTSMGNDDGKDRFVQQARLVCLAHGADAAVFMSEAWMRMPKKLGEAFDASIPPSQAADKVETVIIMGETRTGHCQKILPILRTEQGKFMGFGEMPEIIKAADSVKGRFAQFIPPKVPDEETREMAKQAIKFMGMVDGEEKRERGQGRAMQ